MAEPLVDAVRLDVTSKATLTGLDQSLTKLKALQAALDNIHERLAGLSTGPGLKRTKAEIEETLKAGSKVKTMPVSEVAKTLDIDLEKFRRHVAEWKRLNKEKAKTALTREGAQAGGNEYAFTSASQAAKVASSFYAKEEKARREGEKRMVKLFTEAPAPSSPAPAQAALPSMPPPMQPELPVNRTLPLTVPAVQIVATLGPGMITLTVPPGQVSAAAGNGAARAPSQARDSVTGVGFSPKSLHLFDETAQTVAHNWMVNTEKTLKAHPGEDIHPKPLSQFTQHELAEYAGEGHKPLKETRHWEGQVRPRAVAFAKNYLTALRGEDQEYPLTQAHFSKPATAPTLPPPPIVSGTAKQPELPKAPPPSGNGLVTMDVPVSRLVAVLGPGIITLNVPASALQATAGGPTSQVAGAVGAAGVEKTKETKGAKGSLADREGHGSGGGSGALIEEKTTTTAETWAVQRKELIKAGETVDNYFKEVDGALEHQKEVLTTSPVKAARAKMDAKIAGLKGELEAQLADPSMRQDAAKLAALYRKQAELMRSFVGTAEAPSKAAQELSRLGEGGLVTKARTAASKLEQRAAQAEAQGINQQQAEMGEAMRRQGQLRQELHAARQRGDQAEAARLKQQRQRFEAEMKGRNTMAAAGQKSQDAAEASRRKTAEHELKQRQAAAYRTASYQAADEQMADFLAGGGRVKSRTLANQIRPGSPERVVAERTMPSGEIERMTVSYGKAEATVARLTKAQSEARKEGGYLAADFLKNTAKVTLWAASVGVLYKSLELVTTSMKKLIAVGPQVGRLEQVFKGVGGTAEALTVDIMGLASANGAEVSQAMEAAIQWSRLGLNRVQVNEAVRVSLMAANVAQIDALEATEALQGVMQAYGMQVGQLRGELGQMVQISNTYNVTNKDMLTGLSRCAAVAKQAGLPLAELQGLLGATIGGTAQTGANIGNMMKSVMLALSNPELQSKLRLNFKFEPTTGGEEIKGMSQMLGDVFVKFNQLNQLQRQSFLFTTSGRTQASRLEAMLEGYIKAQYLAINAQLHLNTAEAENEKIVGALRTQLKGLSAEWERFVFIQGSNGPVEAMGQLSTAVRNVLKLMNTPLGSVATTMIGGFLAAGGMKAVMTGMTLKGKDSFMTRSGAAIGGVLSNFNTSLMAVYEASMGKGRAAAATPAVGLFNKVGRGLDIGTGKAAEKMFIWSEAMLRVGKSSMITSAGVRGMATAFGAVTRALGAGLIALEAWIVPIAIVTLGIGAFNVVMEKIGASSEAATAKLAGFNAEAERATAAANAYAEAAQAMGTLQRAITPEQGFPGMGEAERERYLKQASQLAYNYEPDEAKRGRLQEAFGQQLLALNAQNDALGIQKMLQGEITINGQKRLEQLREAAVALEDRRRADQSEIARLTRLNNNSWVGGMFHDSRSQKIRELQKDESEASMARVRNIVDQGDTYEQAFAYSEKWNAELETQKLLWESIAEIFQAVKSNDPMVQSRMKIAALEAESEAMTRYIAILDQQEQADTEGAAKRELAKRANAEAIQDKAGEISAMQEWARKAGVSEANPTKTTYDAWHQPNWGGGGGIEVTYPGEALAKLKGELDLLQQQAPTVEGQADPEWAARQHARQQVREQQKKAEEDAEAQRRNSPIMLARRAIQFGEAEGQRETSPWEIGRDETAKLLNKREGILQRLNELSRLPQDDAVRLSRELALQNQLYETQGALRRRSFDTERDIRQLIIDQRREMEHALLGSGPAELLRKMAAIRMGAGGQMGIGQFMGMSPEMRREVAMVDPRFDPRMMDLQREARRQGRPGAAEFGQEQGRAADRLAELGERLNRVVSQADPEGRAAYNAAAKIMNVTAGTVNVTAPTVIFKGTLTVNGPGAASPAAGGAAPRLAQAGGRGAGVGH